MRTVLSIQHSRVHICSPVTANESVERLLETIGRKVGEPIEPADVQIAHRIPAANSTVEKNLVVQFVRRTNRNALLERLHQGRLNSIDFKFSLAGPVYIDEHLRPELMRLLVQTVERKKEARGMFVWVRNCQGVSRKNETSPILKLNCTRSINEHSSN